MPLLIESALLDLLQQLCWLYREGVGQLYDVDKADVTFASLDSTDVVPVQVCALRQLLLSEAALLP
jgi:hypothetical protein